jgi:hypothetical protein
MPKRTDDSLDSIVREIRRIRPPRYVGTPVQECLPVETGALIKELVFGGFVSVNASRCITNLTTGLGLGGVLIGLVQGVGGNVQAMVHTRGLLYCQCEGLREIGEPVYLASADSLRRVLTMQPADVHTAIPIGTLAAVQPENGVAHIAMAGVGAKPFHGRSLTAAR